MTRHPRALVIYESMFGNTERVADAVARGLELEGIDTARLEVGSAPAELTGDLDLLVVGAPTHAFALSRPNTRADAVRQGAPPERAQHGLREWLESVRFDPDRRPDLAVFDTRITKVRWLPESAGPSAVRVARRHGLPALGRPTGFLVENIRGPVVEGELERAVAWGRRLGSECAARLAAAEVTPRRE